MIDRHKMHNIVEYMKLSDFQFETDEVVENLGDILDHYGLADTELTDDERYLLIDELLPLAEGYECTVDANPTNPNTAAATAPVDVPPA